MMDCAAYRRALGSDPNAAAALREHVVQCPECAAYAAGAQRFEERLRRALHIEVPVARPTVRRLPDSGRVAVSSRRWLAVAASVLVAVLAAGGLWLVLPRPSLAADVVAHMADEPGAWRRTDVAVPGAALAAVLRDAHVALGDGAGPVTYANSCMFRGHQVPHLVLQSRDGPVTVMVLAHEHVGVAVPFDESGYRGVIVPVGGHGSVAVLQRGTDTGGPADAGAARSAAVDDVARRVVAAITWTR